MAETPRRNRPFIAVALACVVIAFAVVGCSGATERGASSTTSMAPTTTEAPSTSTTLTTSPPPNTWPTEYANGYLTGCRKSAAASGMGSPLSIDLFCTCTLEQLQRSLTAEEFMGAEAKMLRGEATGIDMQKIAAGCRLGGA